MKKLFLIISVILVVMVSCKKEEAMKPTNTNSITTQNSNEKINNTLLFFKDKSAFNNTLKFIQIKSREEIIAWEKTYNFTSMFEILNQVNDAENENELKYINGEDVQEHSLLYFDKIKSGVIKEIKYDDGSTSFDYNIFDASVVNLVNEDGLVVIENQLYQYTESSLKSTEYKGASSIELLKSTDVSTDVVKIINITQVKNTGSYSWSQEKGWAYEGGKNKKRARIYVTGHSSGGETSIQVVVYNVNVRVEKKNGWGNWVLADGSSCWLYSSWRYRFQLAKANDIHMYTFYSNSLSPAPILFTNPTTYWPFMNNLTLTLEPNGTWGVPAGYAQFFDPYNVYNYSFTGSVSGGAHGINLIPATR